MCTTSLDQISVNLEPVDLCDEEHWKKKHCFRWTVMEYNELLCIFQDGKLGNFLNS